MAAGMLSRFLAMKRRNWGERFGVLSLENMVSATKSATADSVWASVSSMKMNPLRVTTNGERGGMKGMKKTVVLSVDIKRCGGFVSGSSGCSV